MELIKKIMNTTKTTCRSDMQITLEDDVNVPDSKPDIEHIIKLQSYSSIQEITPEKERVTLRGELHFSLLYLSVADNYLVHTMEGTIPFLEKINMDGIMTDQDVYCHEEINDCQASLINSRKISVRGILSLHCYQEQDTEEVIGTEICQPTSSAEGSLPHYHLHQKQDNLSYTSGFNTKHDILRIKDEFSLPSGKPDCDYILYSEINLRNRNCRITEDGLRMTGDLAIFLLYSPDDREESLEFFETELPFDRTLPCRNCDENTIPDVTVKTGKQSIICRDDDTGNMRDFDLEILLHLDIRFFKEKRLAYLSDAYSTDSELSLKKQQLELKKLLLKNQSQIRLNEELSIFDDSYNHENNGNILQVCNCAGTVRIDDGEIVEKGIVIRGGVVLSFLELMEDDYKPIVSTTHEIFFEHLIEVEGITPSDEYELQAELSQCNISMIDSNKIDAKLTITLDAIVFTEKKIEVVTDICNEPLDMEQYQSLPGLTGYYVKPDDTLWTLAKKFRTTTEEILEINEITEEAIRPGMQLLFMKNAYDLV